MEDVLNFGQDASDRNAVRVRWNKGYTGVYRMGYQGHVDLECVEEAPGGSFYPGHLAPLDLVKQRLCEKTLTDILSVGDTVCVVITSGQLKQLQQVRRNWNTRMEEVVIENKQLAYNVIIHFLTYYKFKILLQYGYTFKDNRNTNKIKSIDCRTIWMKDKYSILNLNLP